MIDQIRMVLQIPAVRGFLAGFLSAALVDFRTWKSYEDARFNVMVASWRWLQGGVTGGLTGAGLGAIS